MRKKKKIESKLLNNCMIKRNILYSTENKEDLISYGDIFFVHERFNDALDFYEKAGAVECIEKIKEKAKASGDVFLLARISKMINVGRDEWVAVSEIAEKLGKHTYASYAKERSLEVKQNSG